MFHCRTATLAAVLTCGGALSLPSFAQTWVSTATQGLGNVLANATPLAALPSSTSLHIAVALQLNNKASLVQYVKAIGDPSNPLYGESLSVDQFVASYAPTSA